MRSNFHPGWKDGDAIGKRRAPFETYEVILPTPDLAKESTSAPERDRQYIFWRKPFDRKLSYHHAKLFVLMLHIWHCKLFRMGPDEASLSLT